MEILFNLFLLLLLVLWSGEVNRDLYFNPIYKKLDLWTRSFYQRVARFLPGNKEQSVHLFLLFLFILLRAVHYFAYRTDLYALKWGSSLLVWKSALFVFALHKALFASFLFYFNMMLIFLILDWVTRGAIQDPIWNLIRSLVKWQEKWVGTDRLKNLVAFFLIGSVVMGLSLLPVFGICAIIPGKEMGLFTFPKILILNLSLGFKVFHLYFMFFFLQALISWFVPYGIYGVGSLLVHLTEPVLAPFRRFQLRVGPIDLTLIIASFVCLILDQIFSNILVGLNILL